MSLYLFVLHIISKNCCILLKLFAGGEFFVKDSRLFLLLPCTLAVQPVRGVFNLDISLIRWFGVIEVLSAFSGVIIVEEVDGVGNRIVWR